MTYKIKRVVHPTFHGKKYEAEVELQVCEDTTTGPNGIGDMDASSVRMIKVLWIADEEGKEVYHHGNGSAIVVVSPEMGLVINDEVEKIEDLTREEE